MKTHIIDVDGQVKKLTRSRCKDNYRNNIKQGDPLTKREHEVMQLVAEGLSNKLIADAIGVCASTAKYHITNALRKFGVTTRTRGAVLYVTMIKGTESTQSVEAHVTAVPTEPECA
jgi:DNA-binding NarL/FixJ family response regulator